MSEVTEGDIFCWPTTKNYFFFELYLFDLQVYNCQDLNCFIFYLQRSGDSVICTINILVSSSRFLYIVISGIWIMSCMYRPLTICKSTLRVTSNWVSFIVARDSCRQCKTPILTASEVAGQSLGLDKYLQSYKEDNRKSLALTGKRPQHT